MNQGKYVYSKPGSDEVIGEAVFSQGFTLMARIALVKGGVKFPDNAIVGYLAAIIAGEEAGIDGVGPIDLRHVDEMAVASAMCRIDVDLVLPDEQQQGEEVGDDEKNPTDTSGETC